MDVSLLVLAAGSGERAGGSKAWHLVHEVPWLQRQLQQAAVSEFTSQLVVLADEPPEPFDEMLELEEWTVNPHPELGPFSSLQVGLRALKPWTSPVLVLPVDVPLPGIRTLEALKAGLGISRAAVPMCEGRGGHPVLLAAGSRRDILSYDASDPDARLDTWLRTQGEGIVRIPVDDRRVLMNLNRAEDFEEFAKIHL